MRPGDFLEHAEYAGNRYGTLRSRARAPGRRLVLEIEVQGARQVRETLPDAVQRLHRAAVGGDAARAPGRARLRHARADRAPAARRARRSWRRRDEFPHVIVNDDLERAAGGARRTSSLRV